MSLIMFGAIVVRSMNFLMWPSKQDQIIDKFARSWDTIPFKF